MGGEDDITDILDWDPSTSSVTTAWSTSTAAAKSKRRGRRAYGKRSNNKNNTSNNAGDLAGYSTPGTIVTPSPYGHHVENNGVVKSEHTPMEIMNEFESVGIEVFSSKHVGENLDPNVVSNMDGGVGGDNNGSASIWKLEGDEEENTGDGKNTDELDTTDKKKGKRSSASAKKKMEDLNIRRLETSEILSSMPSRDDLKFLIRELRKEKRGTVFATLGLSRSWTIAPPSSLYWSTERRTAFLHWTTKDLGFSLRNGGGSVAFLQMPSLKGEYILQLLESAILETKKTVEEETKIPYQNESFEVKEISIGRPQQTPPRPSYKTSQPEAIDETFDALNLNGAFRSPDKLVRKRILSFAKHKRVSLCASAIDPARRMSRMPPRPSLYNAEPIGEVDDQEGKKEAIIEPSPAPLLHRTILTNVFSFLKEGELLHSASLVNSMWADAATDAHARLMLISVGCTDLFEDGKSRDDSMSNEENNPSSTSNESAESIAKCMERPWSYLVGRFPWARFLSEGAFKRVFMVYNSEINCEEAVSVMDVEIIEELGNKHVVGAELAVAVMLSSLSRRNICPNFVITRGVFTCPFEPPASHWGTADNKCPKGKKYIHGESVGRKPRVPSNKNRGSFQYIRMELCSEGDVEEYLKRQPNDAISPTEARSLLFQTAFALYTAGDRFSMKHYDVKLLNIFLQRANIGMSEETIAERAVTVLRYGLGSDVFALRMPTERALLAKLADYGTANVQAESDGQPVNLSHFTTLENTPVDFLILGDNAKQGYGHDSFGLGLCMLHLFTGCAPYEEILESVVCPPALKKKLRKIWQNEKSLGYEVIRSVILADVYTDEDGNMDGEPDEVLYDTLYRFLVLFGIPDEKFNVKECSEIWKAITSTLETAGKRKKGGDAAQYVNDQQLYSVSEGTNEYIQRARTNLESIDGGMDLLMSLVCFDPEKRALPLDVLKSSFMQPLREDPEVAQNDDNEIVHSFMAYLK